MQNGKQTDDLNAAEQISEDLSRLFDYPSVGELFSAADTRRLDDFCAKMIATRENLERIVRYGARDEATRASLAVKAIETTIEFLQTLQKMRQNQPK